jgi:opacity protein-like surface antigen
MKKLLILIGLLYLSSNILCAQETNTIKTEVVVEAPSLHRVEFGLRFMPTFSKFDIETTNGNTLKAEITLGYGVGAMAAFNFSKHIGIQGEAIYNALSQKYTDQEVDRKITVNYMSIPIMLSLNTGKSRPVNLNAVIGPQFGINVGSKATGPAVDTVITVVAAKRNDIGLAYGAGLEFALNSKRNVRLDLGYRGLYGFSNVNRNGESSVLVRTDAGYIGLSLLF